ncbi:hypothetical protein L9F63_001811, partial [Diploptera punctata]
MFHLPRGKSNLQRRILWVQNIGRRSLPNNPFLCEIHFAEDQFERNRADGKKLLKWNAVPTLFTNRRLPLDVAEKISKDLDSLNESIKEVYVQKTKRKKNITDKPSVLRRLLPKPEDTSDDLTVEYVLSLENEDHESTETVKERRKKIIPKKINMNKDDESAASDDEKMELKRRLRIAEHKITELGRNLLLYQNIVESVFNDNQ